MTPDEESSQSKDSPGPVKRPRARRSRRGGRGRSRKPATGAASVEESSSEATEPVRSRLEEATEVFSEPEPIEADTPIPDSPMEEARREVAEAASAEPADYPEEREPAPPSQRPERRDFRPASPAAITEAIDEVNRVIKSLQQVLEQMEEVLETLELAEVQKNADEREIDSLRNMLRQMDRRGPEPRSSEPHEQPAPYQPQGRPQHRHDHRRRGRR
jgi:hypothetical protein